MMTRSIGSGSQVRGIEGHREGFCTEYLGPPVGVLAQGWISGTPGATSPRCQAVAGGHPTDRQCWNQLTLLNAATSMDQAGAATFSHSAFPHCC